MSELKREPNKTKEYRSSSVYRPALLVDTNVLLQKVIQQLPSSLRSEIVLRCDNLPAVQSSEESLEKVFTQLLQLIIAKKELASRLYLYITCSEDKAAAGKRLTGLTSFRIQFHTNITPHAEWMQVEEQQINSIASLLLPFGGSFTVNQLKNSGSVFCISLPGK